MSRPAYYAKTGSTGRDLIALLHIPYTLWHLSYVAIGAGLAATMDWARLGATVLAFGLGLGIGAHALDELNGRPLGTRLSERTLVGLGVGGLAAALGVGIVGAFVVSPWVLAWAVAGVFLAAGYSLEWWRWLHTDLGFAVAWGVFPVIVSYWAQALAISPAALLAAGAALLLSLAQRKLSTPARYVRRRTSFARAEFDPGQPGWERGELLVTWELPLRLVGLAVVLLALALLATHL